MSFNAHSDCPFCPENGKVDIISEYEDVYLVEAKGSPVHGCFLIIPREHVVSIMQLPERWQPAVGHLLQDVPWFSSDAAFNLSFNCGFAAGQRVEHLHAWVIPRDGDSSNSSAYCTGMATVLANAPKLV